jgi:hypothetical protein
MRAGKDQDMDFAGRTELENIKTIHEFYKTRLMNHFTKITISILFLLILSAVTAQEVRQQIVDSSTRIIYATETFKSSRVIIGQSVEIPENGGLVFLISHHFGAVNTGFYNFFGLDQATTRLGIEYGINDWLAAGFGRSTHNKTWDGYAKVRFLHQSTGARKMPISMSFFANVTVNTLKLLNPDQKDIFDARLAYCTELIIARKFGKALSFQVEPVWIHKNLVPTKNDHNDLFAAGAGGSVRVSDRISLNLEYYYLFPDQTVNYVQNSLSVGCDILVGAHVFQLFFTNSQGNFEESFITENNGKWLNGEIYFGFNIHRVFVVKNPKHSKF